MIVSLDCGVTVSERPQHELPQRNPFSTLDTCLHATRVVDRRRSIVGVRLCESKLEAIFPKVIDMVCGHERDIQTVIDTLHDVRPPRLFVHGVEFDLPYLDRCRMPSLASHMSERNV